MTYADAEQELVNTILKDPAAFLFNQFKKGGAFKLWKDETFLTTGGPIIMRLEHADYLYLTVTTWELDDGAIDKNVYLTHTMPIDGESRIPWTDGYSVWGEAYFLDRTETYAAEIAVGKAMREWLNIALRVQSCKPNPEYAWFFPFGLGIAYWHPDTAVFATNRPEGSK